MTHDAEMSCKELVELVTHYLEDALPAHDRARFEAHLAECPWCVEYVAQIERTISLVGASWRDPGREPAVAGLLHVFRDWKREVASRNA
jgi:anti-sigma factor RsiW